jgi:hypothetical protein
MERNEMKATAKLRDYWWNDSEFLAGSDSGFHRALRNDLEDAKDIQKAFLPKKDLSIPGLACETFYRPVQSIGGDYYDFVPLQVDRWGIAIGDVCGKGIGAALLMASLQASLRAQAMHAYSDPSMRNTTLRHACCNTSTPVTMPPLCSGGRAVNTGSSAWNPAGLRLDSWNFLTSTPKPCNSKSEMCWLCTQMA